MTIMVDKYIKEIAILLVILVVILGGFYFFAPRFGNSKEKSLTAREYCMKNFIGNMSRKDLEKYETHRHIDWSYSPDIVNWYVIPQGMKFPVEFVRDVPVYEHFTFFVEGEDFEGCGMFWFKPEVSLYFSDQFSPIAEKTLLCNGSYYSFVSSYDVSLEYNKQPKNIAYIRISTLDEDKKYPTDTFYFLNTKSSYGFNFANNLDKRLGTLGCEVIE